MINIPHVPPPVIFIVGAMLVPLLKGKVKSTYLLMLPVLSFINLINIPEGKYGLVNFLNYDLVLGNIDRLSLVFGYIFHIIAFLALLYGIHLRNKPEYIAGLVYTGAVLGVVFAGDLITLFCFWELMTLAAAFLLWARRTNRAVASGFRYMLFHFFGGVMLLTGIILYIHETGSNEVGYIGLNTLGSYFIFIGVGVNCAWPMLHTWLVDAYPKASIMGTIFMSAFTTKTAVYVLARTFPGTEALIWIGVAMAAFPIFYAVLENDLRMVLSYSIINQVGFMMVGIGIGTKLAINGVAAHAFAHIIYKGLLLMSMGAVLQQTGKMKATNLGGLYKSMPLTCIFCIIGAASISAFPLFSGFISKSMVMSAAADGHMTFVWLVLLFASAGVFHHSGIKIPFFAFFSHDSGIRVKEPPFNMLLAMGIAAFLCIFIGVCPKYLYSILPYSVEYVPYTWPHVTAQMQLLIFSALAFTLLILSGYYPSEMRAINLDVDWFYRKGARGFVWLIDNPMFAFTTNIKTYFFEKIPNLLIWFSKNPATALNITANVMILPFFSTHKRKEKKEMIEKMKAVHLRISTEIKPIGYTIIFICVFFVLFLSTYYVANKDW
ncbi:MAG: Na(+)/H(+) antiporter subunit D [Candidatus Anammoxibacter sp.]